MKKKTAAKKKRKPASKQRKRTAVPSRRSELGIGAPSDWRADTLARVRAIITQADPDIVEAVKWRKPSNAMRGVPVWSHASSGMICTGETYKSAVKVTFARGASLEDPSGLFNASLAGGTRRAVDFHEGDKVDSRALAALVREAVALGALTRPGRPVLRSDPGARETRARRLCQIANPSRPVRACACARRWRRTCPRCFGTRRIRRRTAWRS